MVENEEASADRRIVIRSTSSKPWPAPERSSSSHNVGRHLYKLLQPLQLLRSDNCVSEQDFSSMPQIAAFVTEFPHRLARETGVPAFEGPGGRCWAQGM